MKTRIAVIMGGYSSEYAISIESGEMVVSALSDSDYLPIKVLVLKDRWCAVVEGKEYPIDKNDFSFQYKGEKQTFEGVFNAIHGTPGEDGLIQAYFDLIGMKHTSCDFFESALTFNKSKTNAIVHSFGIKCARGLYFSGTDRIDPKALEKQLGYPMFIKPSRSGSSYGITRVTEFSQIAEALTEARKEDSDVLAEAEVKGTEVGCGLARINGSMEVLAITEIVSKNAFFDYQAKYEGASDEITPARISMDLETKIGDISKKLYSKLGLNGIARVDFIIDENSGEPVFIEVNTVPGLSKASIVPQQVAYKGYSLKDFFTLILRETLSAES